jgi:hypothetical protein
MINQDIEWIPCWYCGKRRAVHNHHAFGGKNRDNSEKYGLKFKLCQWCHEDGPESTTHKPKGEIAMTCKIAAQEQFELTVGDRDMFRGIFHTNVLG